MEHCTVVIFSTGPKHTKFESWTSENANYKKDNSFLYLKSFLCVYITLFLALYQVSAELVFILRLVTDRYVFPCD